MGIRIIQKRLQALREKMAQRNIDMYIIPSSDFHDSEYVGDYFKTREYITGFTGSAGTALVTMDNAFLWTDGRYFIQAEKELEGSGIELFRMGEEGVPLFEKFIHENLPQEGIIGFDGRVVNAHLGQVYEKIAKHKKGNLITDEDLIGDIWQERPELPCQQMYVLEPFSSSELSISGKLAALREKLGKCKGDTHILTSLCDIAWLLNIRGNDIPCVPVTLSYLILTMEECCLYVNERALNDTVREHLSTNKIKVKDYHKIYQDVRQLDVNRKVVLDMRSVNYEVFHTLPQGIEVIDTQNPTVMMKAVKSPEEVENIREAHIKDGVAFTKFMYWLKKNIGKEKITECSAADYLEELRKQQKNFIELSFETISAYGANAAMMHYQAKLGVDALLKQEGLYLVDSGGHYREGTTDITRTIALGDITQKERTMFTAVCRANLKLANAKFLYGCRGWNLDILAREPLWQLGVDYRCGTGHGVGYVLNVHESPNSFRWKISKDMSDNCVLEEGMVTTDEPGYYEEGKFGIRTENELLCVKGEKTEYGQFMEFENLTVAPIDLDALDFQEMSGEEKTMLNRYHEKVYEILEKYMTEDEREWLREYTRKI